MAVIRISNTGGNFNATGTWDGGVVPTSSDSILGDALSGQLTMNVAGTVQFANMSAYTNTLTMNANLTLGLASSTTSFGSSMSFAGTVGQIICNVAHIFRQDNTSRIPNLNLGGFNTKQFPTNMYITNLLGNNGNTVVYSGTSTLYIGGNLQYDGSVLIDNGVNGSVNYVLDGSGVISWNLGRGGSFGNRTFEITGNYQTYGAGLNLTNGNTFIYTGGTAGSNFNLIIGTVGFTQNANNTININQPNVRVFLYNTVNNVINGNHTVGLSGPSTVNSINNFTSSRSYTSDVKPAIYTFTGNSISASTLSLTPVYSTNQTSTISSGSTIYKGISLVLDTSYTHSFTSMKLFGGGIPDKPSIRSNSAGNKVSINLGSKITTQIVDYDFIDVDAVGEEIVAINGTLSNTTNVTNVYPSGSGGGESSYVFIS